MVREKNIFLRVLKNIWFISNKKTIRIKKIKINRLFLIKDQSEFHTIHQIISPENINDFIVLSIDKDYPYLINKFADNDFFSNWEEFGVINPDHYRYWLNNYKGIESLILNDLVAHEDIIKSHYFKLGLIRYLGREYYHYVSILETFFKKVKPNVIYYNPTETFISQLIIAFTNSLKIRHENILWKLLSFLYGLQFIQ